MMKKSFEKKEEKMERMRKFFAMFLIFCAVIPMQNYAMSPELKALQATLGELKNKLTLLVRKLDELRKPRISTEEAKKKVFEAKKKIGSDDSWKRIEGFNILTDLVRQGVPASFEPAEKAAETGYKHADESIKASALILYFELVKQKHGIEKAFNAAKDGVLFSPDPAARVRFKSVRTLSVIMLNYFIKQGKKISEIVNVANKAIKDSSPDVQSSAFILFRYLIENNTIKADLVVLAIEEINIVFLHDPVNSLVQLLKAMIKKDKTTISFAKKIVDEWMQKSKTHAWILGHILELYISFVRAGKYFDEALQLSKQEFENYKIKSLKLFIVLVENKDKNSIEAALDYAKRGLMSKDRDVLQSAQVLQQKLADAGIVVPTPTQKPTLRVKPPVSPDVPEGLERVKRDFQKGEVSVLEAIKAASEGIRDKEKKVRNSAYVFFLILFKQNEAFDEAKTLAYNLLKDQNPDIQMMGVNLLSVLHSYKKIESDEIFKLARQGFERGELHAVERSALLLNHFFVEKKWDTIAQVAEIASIAFKQDDYQVLKHGYEVFGSIVHHIIGKDIKDENIINQVKPIILKALQKRYNKAKEEESQRLDFLLGNLPYVYINDPDVKKAKEAWEKKKKK